MRTSSATSTPASTLLATPSILSKNEFVTLPSGLKYPRPTILDQRKEAKITKLQERLYSVWINLGSSEEQQGRALSIERRIVALENQKHPLLKTWNKHLL